MNSLKGVSKQIVEINYTRDDYVQKAILIINPEKNHLSQSIINKKAQTYLNTLNLPLSSKIKLSKKDIAKRLVYVVSGAIIMSLIYFAFSFI